MALEELTFNIGAIDNAVTGKNYIAGQVYEVFNMGGTLASIFSDSGGLIPIVQDGVNNISNSDGEANFYIAEGAYYVLVNTKRRNFKAGFGGQLINDLSQAYIFDTVAKYKAFTSEFPVGKTIHLNDRDADFTVIAGTGAANTFNIIASTEVTQSIDLVKGMVIKPAQWGVAGTNDASAIQAIYDTISAYTVVDASGLSIDMNSIVTLTAKDNITTQNGRWHWNHQGNNMIALSGTLEKPYFRNMECVGNSDAFLSQGCIGCPSGTITNDWTVENCRFNDMPFGVYVNADSSGVHTNPNMNNNKFENMVRDTTTDNSGMGLGLVFAAFSGNIRGGKSSFNSFKKCGRHSLYVTSGGNITSIGDTFDQHRDDGFALITSGLAALFISRNSKNVTITSPRFSRCRDLALSIQAVEYLASPTFGGSISVSSPIFEDNYAGDFEIGNDSTAVNGIMENIKISDIQIYQKGNSVATRGLVFSGINISIDGIMIEANQNVGASQLVDIIRIEDTSPSLFQFNNITIKDLNGSDTGSSSRGVHVDAGLINGTLDVNLTLENINVGSSSKIFESGAAPVNPNYLKISKNKPVIGTAFTGSFTNQNTEINRVDKYEGKKIYSLSGGVRKPLYANGSLPTDTWVDGVGTVVHTPA